jgi:hypothetical protein
MHGDRRLIFNDAGNQRRVDIFLDVFEMCHKFNFKDRLDILPDTLTPADLLVTKLQVVQMTEREYKDLSCLLLDHEIGITDAPGIVNGAYLAKLAGDDWGVYMTFRQTIQNLLGALETLGLSSDQLRVIKDHAQQILKMIEEAPKTVRWKVRSQVGTRVPWYVLPEADKEIVN